MLSFCCFGKWVLAHRVDGARDLHDSKTTNLQAYLKVNSALKDLSQAIWWLLYSVSLSFRLLLIVMLVAPSCAFTRDTKIRKLRQVLLLQPVHAELMLHWQVSRKLFSVVVVPIRTKRQLPTLEMTPIQKWNPYLNFPYILKERIARGRP